MQFSTQMACKIFEKTVQKSQLEWEKFIILRSRLLIQLTHLFKVDPFRVFFFCHINFPEIWSGVLFLQQAHRMNEAIWPFQRADPTDTRKSDSSFGQPLTTCIKIYLRFNTQEFVGQEECWSDGWFGVWRLCLPYLYTGQRLNLAPAHTGSNWFLALCGFNDMSIYLLHV